VSLAEYQVEINLDSSNFNFSVYDENEIRFIMPLKENVVLDLTFDEYLQQLVDYSDYSNAAYLGAGAGTNADDPNGDFAVFQTYTNSAADINSYGASIGLNTKIFNNFDFGLSYTYAKFDFDQSSDPDFEAGFNTPEHKVKVQFGNTNLFKNVGFNVNLRWQNAFVWESTFLDATVDGRTVIDAQINYSVPKIKSVFKIGGANIGGQEYFSAPGVGAIGSQYYISWTINN
jgi:hypothetical protein